MSDLEKIRAWIAGFPGMERLQRLWVDNFSPRPWGASVAPQGFYQLSRSEDLLGTVTVENRYDYKLYFVLPKCREEDSVATGNARWLMEFQQWVQAQSLSGQIPVFGDLPAQERIVATQGKLEELKGEGTAIYGVKLSVFFTKIFAPRGAEVR